MDANEKIIYGYIKEAGSKGIWQKDLKIKSGIHQKQVLASLKALEKRKIIKTVKSIKVGYLYKEFYYKFIILKMLSYYYYTLHI